MSILNNSSQPATERVSDRSAGIDTMPPEDVLALLWQDQMDGVTAVRDAIPQLREAAVAVAEQLQKPDSCLVYVGAGTSGVVAALDGIELPCTFGWPEDRLKIFRADHEDNVLSIATAQDDTIERAMSDFEKSHISNSDVVVAASASGNTPYTCRFADLAQRAGALVVGMASNKGSSLLDIADHPVLLDTGPEVIAGSTRLKAGTAQKAALGMFSTLIMIRLGHVHDGYMVDVTPDNDKLRLRAIRMVAAIADVSESTARHALAKGNNHVKTASLIAKGLTPSQARTALAESGQSLRKALIRIAEA